MAKYVCDFDQINAIINNMKSSLENTKSLLDECSNNVDSELSGWTGDAKNKFITSKNSQITLIKENIQINEEIVDFIKVAVNAIQDAEATLASLKI